MIRCGHAILHSALSQPATGLATGRSYKGRLRWRCNPPSGLTWVAATRSASFLVRVRHDPLLASLAMRFVIGLVVGHGHKQATVLAISLIPTPTTVGGHPRPWPRRPLLASSFPRTGHISPSMISRQPFHRPRQQKAGLLLGRVSHDLLLGCVGHGLPSASLAMQSAIGLVAGRHDLLLGCVGRDLPSTSLAMQSAIGLVAGRGDKSAIALDISLILGRPRSEVGLDLGRVGRSWPRPSPRSWPRRGLAGRDLFLGAVIGHGPRRRR
jgi:hypothetical protein